MKIHPLFVAVIDRLKLSSPYFEEFSTWERAGKPVVEEGPATCLPSPPMFPCCIARDAKIKELEKKLADYKIQLVEKEHDLMRKFEDWGLFSGLTGRFSNPTDIRNAALEEAVREVESLAPVTAIEAPLLRVLVTRIRALKRDPK